MRMHRIIGLTAILIVLALAGCGPVPDEPDGGEETSEQTGVVEPGQPELEPASPAEAADFSYLTGKWDVVATLTDIDRTAMQEGADVPRQHWECTLKDTTMTLVTDTHTYVGTLEPEIGDGWLFAGVANLTDEDGVAWTNHLTLRGVPAGDDAIAGTMELAVDSDSLGHSYTANWDFEGHRQ